MNDDYQKRIQYKYTYDSDFIYRLSFPYKGTRVKVEGVAILGLAGRGVVSSPMRASEGMFNY